MGKDDKATKHVPKDVDDAMRRLIRVPKEELDRAARQQKKQKQKRQR